MLIGVKIILEDGGGHGIFPRVTTFLKNKFFCLLLHEKF